LIKDSSLVGSNKAATGTNWPTSSLGTATYGGSSDLWGTTWTVSDINSANFGVALSATNPNTGHDRDATVDYMRITVTYTPDTTPPIASLTLPTEGSTVSGTVTINADASDSGSGIAKVEFWYASVGTKMGHNNSARG
jgi:hypothetical protein